MESFLDSKLNPLVALGKRGTLKGFVNKFNAEAELLDDLVRPKPHDFCPPLTVRIQNDHWTSKGHKVGLKSDLESRHDSNTAIG